MDRRLQELFLYQIESQCSFVLMAAQDLEQAIVNLQAEPAVRSQGRRLREPVQFNLSRYVAELPHMIAMKRIFFAIQALLTASANIQKALWGNGGRAKAERKPLRDLLGVSDDSALQVFEMRNNFDHFDERLSRWFAENPKRHYVDMSVSGPSQKMSEKFRALDLTTMTVTFWDDEFALPQIIDAVRDLHSRAASLLYPTQVRR